ALSYDKRGGEALTDYRRARRPAGKGTLAERPIEGAMSGVLESVTPGVPIPVDTRRATYGRPPASRKILTSLDSSRSRASQIGRQRAHTRRRQRDFVGALVAFKRQVMGVPKRRAHRGRPSSELLPACDWSLQRRRRVGCTLSEWKRRSRRSTTALCA
ncbi:MAG: hypothetical protein ACREX3_17945, partial [Gammaproteobacteria bacterium]